MSFPNSNASFTSQPPFYKEGIVMRKHLLESGDQKAKNRDWKECMIVVTRGELQVFSVSANGGEVNHRRSMLRASSASLVNLADSFKTGGGGNNSFSGATLQPQHLSVSTIETCSSSSAWC
jgi:Pleckstrin homology domain